MTIRHSLFACLAACACIAGVAQTADDIVMTVNGKAVTRGEFEYSYGKNADIEGAVEKKSVNEYAEMFLNYKLKVAAAETAHLDTLSSFRKEFAQYRDMQLMPALVDSTFIDSVAQSIYARTQKQLGGQDMLRLSHILIAVPQNAPAETDRAARLKADSIFAALESGADFATLAQQHSQDPGTASKGGELPWIGPGMTLREFETAAYAIKTAGQCVGPIHTSVGYHIVKLLERKQLEPYDTLRPEIVTALKRQGIEDASAENKLRKILAASNGRLTREAVMDSLRTVKEQQDPNLKYLIQEYHDGLLLYEISKREVWDAAAKDEAGMERTFKANKKSYAWTTPHFKGFVLHAKTTADLKAAKKMLKKEANGDWKKALREQINKDSIVVRVTGPYIVAQGENRYVDECVFGVKDDKKTLTNAAYPLTDVYGKKLAKPKSYTDVKAAVEADYQKELETKWIASLRSRIPFTIDHNVLATVKER